MALLRLLSLPVRAPFLTLLFCVAVVLGNHWNLVQPLFSNARGISPAVFWSLELLQVLTVVVVCTMPSLVMRQFSLLMAYSRFMTLMVNLFVVVTVGIYVLFLNLLSDLLVLASAVLLARLDLARVGVSLKPFTSVVMMAVIVFAGIGLGHVLPNPVQGWFTKNLVAA
jgi:hypothetical protein